MIRMIFLALGVAIQTLVVLFTLIPGLFLSRYGAWGKAHLYLWSKVILKLAGIKLNITGRENFDDSKSYVVAANHRHLLDIPVVAVATRLNMKFIAKKELFKIPIFGLVLHLVGMVKVDRGNSQKAIESVKKAQDLAEAHKISLAIFPEGTRSKKPELLPFKKGAFMMSINTGIPLLPISVEGTDKVIQGTKCIGRTINVHIHPPVSPEQYGMENRNAFVKDVREIIKSKPHF